MLFYGPSEREREPQNDSQNDTYNESHNASHNESYNESHNETQSAAWLNCCNSYLKCIVARVTDFVRFCYLVCQGTLYVPLISSGFVAFNSNVCDCEC